MRRVLLAIAILLSAGAPVARAQGDSTTAGWSPYLVVSAMPTRPEGMTSSVSSERRLSKDDRLQATVEDGPDQNRATSRRIASA